MEGATVETTLVDALSRIPRALFLPTGERSHAGDNVPLPIGLGQTNSQPSTVADMLELLDPQPGERILDLGSGSGWTTALLGILVGEHGSVIGVERHEELIRRSREALTDHGVENTRIEAATPGRLGLPESGPFDRILVSAGAETLPSELIEQLRVGGVMVIPVAGEMLRVVRTGNGVGDYTSTKHGRYRFVPLIRE
ncbi:MAG: protein-L-isoaspartate O-methyltransferase family protein [Brevibacterium sp.]